MSAQEMIFTIRLDDGSLAEARTWDTESARTFRKLIEDPTYGRDVRIRAVEPPDTSGHAMADTITVSVRQEDDLEGHTMTLRFPSVDEAKRFQKRLIISGALAASVVVGVAGAQLATHQNEAAAPAAGPAITVQQVRAPAPLDSMKPGNIDARLRDSSVVSPSSVSVPAAQTPADIDAQLRDSSAVSSSGAATVISPAKDAKDDAASGISSDTTDSSAGNRGVMPR